MVKRKKQGVKRTKRRNKYNLLIIFGIGIMIFLFFYLIYETKFRCKPSPYMTITIDKNQLKWVQEEIDANLQKLLLETPLPIFIKTAREVSQMMINGELSFRVVPGIDKPLGVMAWCSKSKDGKYIIYWSALTYLYSDRVLKIPQSTRQYILAMNLYHELIHIKLGDVDSKKEDLSEEECAKRECRAHSLTIINILRPLAQEEKDLFSYYPKYKKFNEVLLKYNDNFKDKRVLREFLSIFPSDAYSHKIKVPKLVP